DSEDTTADPLVDLSIVKSDTVDPVLVGGAFGYTLAVSNAGPSPAQAIVVTDELPAGVSYVSASGTGWTCARNGQLVTCTRASLGLGAAPMITLNVKAPPQPMVLLNTASVTSATPESVLGNNQDGEQTTILGQPVLAFAKAASQAAIFVGES